MLIVPKSKSSERFTVLNQHFTYLASFFCFRKFRKPLRYNYFSSAKYLMVRTIWLV